MARGAYLKDLGNTPGHLNHWSKRAFVELLVAPRRGRRGALAVPVDHAARPPLSGVATRTNAAAREDATRSYGRGARILSVGIATTGLVTFAYFSLASHALSEVDYKGISLLWSVMFLIISIIYRPVEQLLSRTISARRARGLDGGHPLRTGDRDPGGVRGAVPGRRAGVPGADRGGRVRRLRGAVLGAGRRRASPTRSATSPAAGWPGTRASGSTAGSCCWSPCSRCLFALAVVLGIARGQGVVALGIAAAPLVSLMVVPWALRGRDPAPPRGRRGRRRARRRARREHALRRRRAGDHGRRAGAAQRAGGDRRRDGRGRRAGRLRVQRAADHARAAAAVPGDPDLAAPAPLRAGGDRRRRGLRAARCASRCWPIAGFAGAGRDRARGVGPLAMDVLFGGDFDYARGGLVLVGHRDGLPPRPPARSTRPRSPATARASPPRPGSAARRCSSAGCSSRRSTTSCSRSRSATAPPPPCSRACCG